MEQKGRILFLASLKLDFLLSLLLVFVSPLVFTFYKEALRMGQEFSVANSEGLGTIDNINSYGSVSQKD